VQLIDRVSASVLGASPLDQQQPQPVAVGAAAGQRQRRSPSSRRAARSASIRSFLSVRVRLVGRSHAHP
jgi:hypothetical protein